MSFDIVVRSYYEIFNVSRSASRSEIRAAYISLMKRHHPDIGVNSQSASSKVALFNRCYAVLRDPVKRAEYDDSLARESAVVRARAEHHQELVATKVPRRTWRFPLPLLVVAAAIVLLCLGWEARSPNYEAGSFLGWGNTPVPRQPRQALRSTEVASRARIATMVSTDQAIVISERCFDAARVEKDLAAVRLCIIFDDAFLYWRQNANGYDSLPVYFATEPTRMRHLDALGEADEAAENELAELRNVTFRALLAQLRGTANESEAAAATGGDEQTSAAAEQQPVPKWHKERAQNSLARVHI